MIYSPLSIPFPLPCLVKLADWRHGVCNEKHPSTLSLVSFFVYCLDPSVFLSLYLDLIDVMSLLVVFERHKCLCGLVVQL